MREPNGQTGDVTNPREAVAGHSGALVHWQDVERWRLVCCLRPGTLLARAR
jgi:hypothetical protein